MNDDLLMDFSILSRSTQKYYDRRLEPWHLTYGQLPVLLMVYERPGISLNDIVRQGQYDKGTVTKNVQKLQSLGFLEIRTNAADKRARELYPTDQAKQVTVEICRIQQDWWNHLRQGLEDQDKVLEQTRQMTRNAGEYENGQSRTFPVYKAVFMDLQAWPDHVAAVLETAGCNFRCPDCPHKNAILPPKGVLPIALQTILEEIRHKRKLTDGVVIQGGEPLMQQGLEILLKALKRENLPVRLEINGSHPKPLKVLLEKGLVDSVLLEIKGSREVYARRAGLDRFDTGLMEETLQILRDSKVEFQCHMQDEEAKPAVEAWLGPLTWLEREQV